MWIMLCYLLPVLSFALFTVQIGKDTTDATQYDGGDSEEHNKNS